MPLPNLFQKRNSQKNKKDKNSSKGKESQASPKTDTVVANENVLPEVNELLQELVSNVSSNDKALKESISTTSAVASDDETVEIDSVLQTNETVSSKMTDGNGIPERDGEKFEEKTKVTSSEQSDVSTPEKATKEKETHTVSSDAKSSEESIKHASSGEDIDTISKNSNDIKKSNSALSNAMNRTETSKSYPVTHSSDSADNDETKKIPKPKQNSKVSKQKKRSSSISHMEANLEGRLKGRRKFGSEGEVLSVNENIFPMKQKKELDEVIGKYVDKLIRDSIVKAVRNVNVDSLYEEIVKDFSNRRSSESAESVEEYTVKQRLSSHSISELVELEDGENEMEDDSADCSDSISHNYNQKLEDANELEFDNADHVSLVGYLADYEDTTSVDDIKSIEENSSICLSLNELGGQIILNIDDKNVKSNSEEITKNSESFSVTEKTIHTSEISESGKENKVIASPPPADQQQEHQSEANTAGYELKLSSVKYANNMENNILESEAFQGKQNATSSETSSKQEDRCFLGESDNRTENNVTSPESTAELAQNILPSSKSICLQEENMTAEGGDNTEQKQSFHVNEIKEHDSAQKLTNKQEQIPSPKNSPKEQKKQKCSSSDDTNDENQKFSSEVNSKETQKCPNANFANEEQDLIVISPEDDLISNTILPVNESEENENLPPDIDENLPQQTNNLEEEKKVNWKAGYLHVKLPHKSRGKTHLKAWKKRCVAIQPDEFVNDPKNPSLVISVYGAESKKHGATFWQTVSSEKAVVYRSSSRTHRYAFTISEDGHAIIHLSAESESATQEWMASIRAVLWPPSPFMELEKMLSGREFEISLIDNEFSYHAGLLGMYGYLTITPRKLILLHPQQGFVIQEWYLNTVDKFQLVPQPKPEDAHKVLAMVTCSDSSTGKGEILLFCNEAVTLLQSLASTIHQVLTYHSKQEGGRYQKELEEMADWMTAPTQDSLKEESSQEEHYKVPTRQVKSLLDIPNFIFEKSLSPVASAIYPAPPSVDVIDPLTAVRTNPITTSHDSGISTCTSSDDFLNCSSASFVLGGGTLTGKSSDSELSDAYTPPRSPVTMKKKQKEELKEDSPVPEASS